MTFRVDNTGVVFENWRAGEKLGFLRRREVGGADAQQKQMLLLCGEKSTTPLPSSLAGQPLGPSLPSLGSTEKAEGEDSPSASHT